MQNCPIPGVDSVQKCDDMTLYFATAQFSIDTPSQQQLEQSQNCFVNQFRYRIEGHCDDRGTTEYNLSLGQKRAHSLEQYLLSKGILPDQISTISYGEERPVQNGQDEASWSKNRRAVIVIQE